MMFLLLAIASVSAQQPPAGYQTGSCNMWANSHTNKCSFRCTTDCRVRISGCWGNRGKCYNNVNGANTGSRISYGADFLAIATFDWECRRGGRDDWRGAGGCGRQISQQGVWGWNQWGKLNCSNGRTVNMGIFDTDWNDNHGSARLEYGCAPPPTPPPTPRPTAMDSNCGWMPHGTNTGINMADNGLQCQDRTFCDGKDCCKCKGGRFRCPKDFPFMCAENGGPLTQVGVPPFFKKEPLGYAPCTSKCIAGGPYGDHRPCGTGTGPFERSSGELAADDARCQPVDCVMKKGEIEECTKECGGGVQVTNWVVKQEALRGGKECGPAKTEKPCNKQKCTPQPTPSPTVKECDVGVKRESETVVDTKVTNIPSDCQEFCMEDGSCVMWSMSGADCSLLGGEEEDIVEVEDETAVSGDNECDAAAIDPLPTAAPVTLDTLPPTDPPTEPPKSCRDFDGDKKGCNAAGDSYAPPDICAYNKKNDKCMPYSCADMPQNGIKCEKKAKKFGMECFYDISTKTCGAANPSTACVDFSGSKKFCKKLSKMHGSSCKWGKHCDKSARCQNKSDAACPKK